MFNKERDADKVKVIGQIRGILGEKSYFDTSIAEINLKAGGAQGTFYMFPNEKVNNDERLCQWSSRLRQHIKLNF